jgi:hypothetical protein
LREFRDGSNMLYKVDEVEGLGKQQGQVEAEAGQIPESDRKPQPAGISQGGEPPEPQIEAEQKQPFDNAQGGELVEPESSQADEILLAADTEAPILQDDLTNADTALTGHGTSILGQTDEDYKVTDDTLAKTAIEPELKPQDKKSKPKSEDSEEDVNLDSVGSGSGLLDLSLQADDTSLGGILDEIYTAEGQGPPAEKAKAGTSLAAAAAADQMISDQTIASPSAVPQGIPYPAVVAQTSPDSQSNILGMLLFLPFIIVIYTAIVTISGLRGIAPSIQTSIQAWIWPVMGALAVLSAIVAGAAYMTSRPRKPAEPKVMKEKPPKRVKPAKA